MYAAQWFAAMRRAIPDLDERIERGELHSVFDWLRDNISSQGSRWTTDELAIRASAEPLNPAHFKATSNAATRPEGCGFARSPQHTKTVCFE